MSTHTEISPDSTCGCRRNLHQTIDFLHNWTLDSRASIRLFYCSSPSWRKSVRDCLGVCKPKSINHRNGEELSTKSVWVARNLMLIVRYTKSHLEEASAALIMWMKPRNRQHFPFKSVVVDFIYILLLIRRKLLIYFKSQRFCIIRNSYIDIC